MSRTSVARRPVAELHQRLTIGADYQAQVADGLLEARKNVIAARDALLRQSKQPGIPQDLKVRLDDLAHGLTKEIMALANQINPINFKQLVAREISDFEP